MCDYEQLLNDADMIGLQVIEKTSNPMQKDFAKAPKSVSKKI